MNKVHDKAKKNPKKLLFPEMRMTSKIGFFNRFSGNILLTFLVSLAFFVFLFLLFFFFSQYVIPIFFIILLKQKAQQLKL